MSWVSPYDQIKAAIVTTHNGIQRNDDFLVIPLNKAHDGPANRVVGSLVHGL